MGFMTAIRSKLSRENAPAESPSDQNALLDSPLTTENKYQSARTDSYTNNFNNQVPDRKASEPQRKPFKNTAATTPSAPSEADQRRFENYYSESEKEKLRSKGINPALKAEMEINRKEGGGSSIVNKLVGSGVGTAPGSIT